MTKELIYIAVHKEERDQQGELITPSCIFKFYENKGKDCFGEEYTITAEQIYARRNKKMNSKVVTVDDFKGAKGIQETFYSVRETKQYLEMLINEGYVTKRATKFGESGLAEDIYKYLFRIQMNKASFKLPS